MVAKYFKFIIIIGSFFTVLPVAWSYPTVQDSFFWWQSRKTQLPIVKTFAIDKHLSRLLGPFAEFTYKRKQIGDFHFSVADTLNGAIWNQGNGYFIVHSGVFRPNQDLLLNYFILTLEMAHDFLQHQPSDVPLDKGVLWNPSIFGMLRPELFNIDGFVTVLMSDPILKMNNSYSEKNEEDALELVEAFFKKQGLDYFYAADLFVKLLKDKNSTEDYKSILKLHQNLPKVFYESVMQTHNASNRALSDALKPLADFLNEIRKTQSQLYHRFFRLEKYYKVLTDNQRTIQRDMRDWEKITESDLSVRNYVLAKIHIKYGNFNKALEILDKELMKSEFGAFEPYLYSYTMLASLVPSSLAKDLSNKEKVCQFKYKDKWFRYEYLLRGFEVQCLLINGYLSAALEKAQLYHRDFPREPFAVFWYGLSLLRLRMPEADSFIAKERSEWGDRAVIRSLMIIQAAYKKNWNLVHDLAEELAEENDYTLMKKGVIDFARAWAFAGIGDHKAPGFLNRAIEEWPPARQVWKILPQNP